ncbi:MAG: putative toxin-antitoxin system toxin component, PIN family [Azonexus sp.]|jgi:putative PIN family toxin of toxin-antitoxin system|nr:putative toxin-antitoxin system toxin component, PIN family [Azonexus sp.]
MLSFMAVIVLDTNVFVSALRSEGGASREVLRRIFQGRHVPLLGNALWLEYEDLLGRPFWPDTTTAAERRQLLAALAKSGKWVSVYYGWRPNLPDEADNHLIELAIAGGAQAIVTHNVKDVGHGELTWKHLHVLPPAQFLETFA